MSKQIEKVKTRTLPEQQSIRRMLVAADIDEAIERTGGNQGLIKIATLAESVLELMRQPEYAEYRKREMIEPAQECEELLPRQHRDKL